MRRKRKINKRRLTVSILIMLLLIAAASMWIVNIVKSHNSAGSGDAAVTEEMTEQAEESTAEEQAEDEAQKAEEEAPAKAQTEEMAIASHVYSHRGSAGPKEHSFEAYDAAIEAGSRYIEQDVVVSADNVLYVSHDENALAMTGYNGAYEYMSSETIDGLTTGAGNKILRLSEVFDKYGKDINYVIELKSNSDACIQAFEKMVDEYGLSDNIIVSSMHAAALESLEKKYPDMPKLFVCWNQGDLDYVLDLPYVDIISVRAETETGIFTESNCKATHEAGKQFSAWTINTEDEIKKAIDMGADSYYTDDTALALSIEKDYGKQIRAANGTENSDLLSGGGAASEDADDED